MIEYWIKELGFPIAMVMALLGMLCWMMRSLLSEIKELRFTITGLKESIGSLKIAIACWLTQDGAKSSKVLELLNGNKNKI